MADMVSCAKAAAVPKRMVQGRELDRWVRRYRLGNWEVSTT